MLSTLQEQCLGIINYGSDLDVQAVSNDVVREILKYLHENYYQDISLRELADQYYLNPSYLCRTFKKQVGKPFTVYLANLRPVSYTHLGRARRPRKRSSAMR